MATFPETALLEDFQYGDGSEYPLSHDGRWHVYGDRYAMQQHNYGATPGTEYAVNGAFWTQDVWTGNAEVWACTGGGQLGAALESWRVELWQSDPNLMIGYSWGYGGGIGKGFFMRIYTGGGAYTGLTYSGGTDANYYPEKMGMRLTSTGVEGWAKPSASDWEMIGAAGDTTYRGAFYGAIACEEQGGTTDLGFGCFGGGVKNRQHIYRVLRTHQGVPA